MIRYLFQRLLSVIPILLVVSVVVFFLVHITPGDPATVILGDEATDAERQDLREQLGLDQPVYTQFFNWLGGAVQGDLGDSFFMNMSVVEAFMQHIQPTISLAIFAQIIAIIISVSMGILAAKKRGTILDAAVMGTSLLGISIPSFLLGMILVLVFAVQLQWLPVAGFQPINAGFLEHIRYLILPAFALGVMQAALIARMTRSSMLDVLNNGYIKTAKAKGLNERVVLFKHAFRNAFIPILTVLGESFGTLITGAAVIETVFNIPGIGQLIVNSIERRDLTVIQGTVLLITVTYVVINLIVDLLYGYVDPRVRLSGRKGGNG